MERPIGYWLREVDRRLESAFAAALAERGVARREWQVLNGLGPDDPFFGPGEVPYADVLAGLVARGWAAPDGSLTAEGRAARASIAAAVDALRRRAVLGVPGEDYQTTVRTLATMAANLSPSP